MGWAVGLAASFFAVNAFLAINASIRKDSIVFYIYVSIATIAWVVLVRAFYEAVS